MITGLDYIYLSNVPPSIVIPRFKKKILRLWPMPIVEEFDRTNDKVELFFARDAQMNQQHEDLGYTLNIDGEGCFMLSARRIDFLQGDIHIINWKTPVKMANIEPYDAHLSLLNAWEYTLVLPGQVTESKFLTDLHLGFMSVLCPKSKLTRTLMQS